MDRNRAPVVNDFAGKSALRRNSPIIVVRVIMEWGLIMVEDQKSVQQLAPMEKGEELVKRSSSKSTPLWLHLHVETNSEEENTIETFPFLLY